MKKFWVFPSAFFFQGVILLSFVAGSPFVLLHQKDGIAVDDYFGTSVAGIGDVDGDGVADFIVGAREADPNGVIASGSAYVYSGAIGAVLYQINGIAQGDFLGTVVSGAGDLNGDGRADFMVSAPYTDSGGLIDLGTVYLYSGIDGSLLYRLTGSSSGNHFGSAMLGLGDIDSDGKSDFIIVGGGSALVYSGATGALVYQISPPSPVYSVAGMEDIDGDGKPDIIVGTPNINSVFLFSGESGNLIRQIDGSTIGGGFGYAVSVVGDINNDGNADIVVGAPYFNPGTYRNHFVGSVLVYSGSDGSLLFRANGPADSCYMGSSVSGTGDVDGDGTPDFITGALAYDGPLSGGFAFVYSGATGEVLFQKYRSNSIDALGRSVAGTGDVNSDGRADFIIGAPGSQTGINRTGSAFAYGLVCPVVKGDMDGDSILGFSDIVLMLNCVFMHSGICTGCSADVDCNGNLSPADVILELYAVFLSRPFPC